MFFRPEHPLLAGVSKKKARKWFRNGIKITKIEALAKPPRCKGHIAENSFISRGIIWMRRLPGKPARARTRARSLSHPPAAIHVAAPECPHSVSLAWARCIQPLLATAGCIAACVPPALRAPLPASCGPYAVRCSALLTRLCARSLVCSIHADNFVFFIVASGRGRQGGNHGLTDLRLQWAVVLG